MKISVIIPIYNTEKYLSECVDSVLNQTLKDIEVILINDGSPDNSSVLCENYVKTDKRIRYFHQKNSGVSVARNFGLKKACSEFIFFMDSDDFLNDSSFLQTAYDTALATQADIVVLGNLFKNRMPHPPALSGWGFLLKKSFWDIHSDIIFPVGIQPCEDGLFSHQLLALTDKIAFEPNVSYFYRQHDGSNTTHMNKQCADLLNQVPHWFNILTDFYNKHNLWEQRSEHLLKFLEHEPFELRFMSMPFTPDQYTELFNIIHDFYNDYLEKYITPERFNSTSRIFQLFLTVSDDKVLQSLYRKILWKREIETYLSKFIPWTNMRRQVRHKLRHELSVLENSPFLHLFPISSKDIKQ